MLIDILNMRKNRWAPFDRPTTEKGEYNHKVESFSNGDHAVFGQKNDEFHMMNILS